MYGFACPQLTHSAQNIFTSTARRPRLGLIDDLNQQPTEPRYIRFGMWAVLLDQMENKMRWVYGQLVVYFNGNKKDNSKNKIPYATSHWTSPMCSGAWLWLWLGQALYSYYTTYKLFSICLAAPPSKTETLCMHRLYLQAAQAQLGIASKLLVLQATKWDSLRCSNYCWCCWWLKLQPGTLRFFVRVTVGGGGCRGWAKDPFVSFPQRRKAKRRCVAVVFHYFRLS